MIVNCSSRWISQLALALALLVVSPVFVLADGSSRKATKEEKGYHRQIQELFASVLPATAPDGWETTDQTYIKDIEYVSEGAETMPLQVDYRVQWNNVILERQAEEEKNARLMQMMATPSVNEQQMKEYEALIAKVAQAAATGDMTTVQALQPELEQKADIIKKSYAVMDDKITAANREQSPKDISVTIQLYANRLYQSLDAEAKKMTIAGFPAFRSEGSFSPSGDWHEGTTTVFLGERWFSPPGQMAYQFANEENAPHTRLQAIVLSIEGDSQRSDQILQHVDWSALQAALQQ